MKAFDQEKRFKGEIFNGFVISQPYVGIFLRYMRFFYPLDYLNHNEVHFE